MSAPLRFGLVGAGAIAQTYLQVFRQCTEAQLVGVADTRAEAASSFAEQLDSVAFSSVDHLVDAMELDAVLLSTPPVTHPDLAIQLLERGIPVLCEKPLAVDVAAAEEMIGAAERTGTLLTMAAKFRFAEDVVAAKSLVASGAVGDLLSVEIAFTSQVSMAGRWNADPAVSGGGVIIDNGTHAVDIARYFLGPITSVAAVEGTRPQGLDVEETATLFLRSIDDVAAVVDLSWSINKELENYVSVFGTRGTIKVGWRDSRYRLAGNADWVTFGGGYDKVQAVGGPVENFCHVLRGDERLRIRATDALSSVAVIDAAYETLGTARWADVVTPPCVARVIDIPA